MVKRHFTTMLAAALLIGAAPGAMAAGAITVALDNARPVTLPGEATSVVVGNPAIADIYVQDASHVFVLGRSYGTTNLVAVDREGNLIADLPVTVTSPKTMDVTMHRGTTGQISYACNGRCEKSLVPTDQPDHFKILQENTNAKTNSPEQVAEAAREAGQ